MNLMKIFVLGRRAADTFARTKGAELDDAGTLSLLDHLLARWASNRLADKSDQALLSYVTLLTAHRYYVQADKFLKTCRIGEHRKDYDLPHLPEWLSALRSTLNFYAQIETAPSLPQTADRSVQLLTNQLFAWIAVNHPDHLDSMESAWGAPPVFALLTSRARDPLAYEPVFSPTHLQFITAIEQTHCIFAPSGKYWGADDWRDEESFDRNVARFARGLFRFMTVACKEKFKGFAFRMPAAYSSTVDELAKTTARFLSEMNRIDPAQSRCLSGQPGTPGWKFDWAGEPMFLTTFGTCYPPDHPRYPHGFDHTYYFFQPDFVLRHHPGLVGDMEAISRERILSSFNKHGMDYDNENKAAESARYIRPLNPKDPPVAWWDHLPVTQRDEDETDDDGRLASSRSPCTA